MKVKQVERTWIGCMFEVKILYALGFPLQHTRINIISVFNIAKKKIFKLVSTNEIL